MSGHCSHHELAVMAAVLGHHWIIEPHSPAIAVTMEQRTTLLEEFSEFFFNVFCVAARKGYKSDRYRIAFTRQGKCSVNLITSALAPSQEKAFP